MLQWADQLPTSPPVGNREKPFCLQCPEWERSLLMSHNHWRFPLSPYCCTSFFAKYVIILRSLLCLRRSVCSRDILGSLYKFSILKEDDWVKKFVCESISILLGDALHVLWLVVKSSNIQMEHCHHIFGLKETCRSSSLPQKTLLLKRLISSPAFNSMTLWHHTTSSCHVYIINDTQLVWQMKVDLSQLLCCCCC